MNIIGYDHFVFVVSGPLRPMAYRLGSALLNCP